MKRFEQPDFEIIRFEYEDIMTSGINNDGSIFDQEVDGSGIN